MTGARHDCAGARATGAAHLPRMPATVPSPPDRADAAPCRSKSPDADPCAKPRGHRTHWHQGADPSTRRWDGGVRTPARWEYIDDGYRSEGDYEAMRMTGLRW